jgi:anti-sigma factor RsiW
MKSDVLERLLMDRALGQLGPDVEALLADYLANNPAAAAQAQELQDVVDAATEAVRPTAPALELPNQIHRLMWRHRAEQVFAVAASFVVGVGITALVLRANLRRENVAILHSPIRQGSPALATKIESLPFWSCQRAYLLASVGQPPSKARAN